MINKVESLMHSLGSGEAASPAAIRTLPSTAMPATSPGDDDDEDAPDTLSLEEAMPGPVPSLEDMTAVVAYVYTNFVWQMCHQHGLPYQANQGGVCNVGKPKVDGQDAYHTQGGRYHTAAAGCRSGAR